MAEHKPITEDARRGWGALSRASLTLSVVPDSLAEPFSHIHDEIATAQAEMMEEFGYSNKEEFAEAIALAEVQAVQASITNSKFLPKPCPAGNPDCDAQVYSSGDMKICPKCKRPNPNFRQEQRVTSSSTTIAGKTPVADIKAGRIQWK